MEVKKDILWRVYLSFIGVVVFSLFVVGRAFYIQNAEGEHWRSLSDSLHQKFVELEAERGTIYSEDGQMLSTSIPYYNIYIDFKADGLRDKKGKVFHQHVDSFAWHLAHLFNDKSAAAYKRDLKEGFRKGSRYWLLHKNVSFEQYKQFRDFPLVRLGRNRSGVIVEEKSKRLNPFGLLARRTIGLSREHAQNVGLERTYDSLLTGVKGRKLVRFIAGGAAIPIEGYEIEAENGNDIHTTIDIRMQDIVQSSLMRMMVQSGSEQGTCIVMETATGKIKAIANLGRTADGSYDETLNYALATTEPGSTIKLATLLAVLDHGSSKMTDMVQVGTAGSAYVGVRNVNDAERSPKPVLSVKECFAHSSNVGMSKLAYKAFASEPDAYKKYLHKFHLHQRTGIDLLGEGAPRLPLIKRNKEGLHAMLTASFGYAIQVSPLHTLMLYNAVANNGKMMKPYLVNSIRKNGITVKDFEPVVLDEAICKPEVIAAAKECMVAVTTEGTAKAVFKDFSFPVAGKTGTAHVAGGKLKYSDGVYQASFAGFFPADKPEYSCIVVIRTRPHAALHYGGQLAAPVFKDIAREVHAMYVQKKQIRPASITPDSSQFRFAGHRNDLQQVLQHINFRVMDSARNGAEWLAIHASSAKSVAYPVAQDQHTMPDVRNMTLRDALYALESRGLQVQVRGRGKVAAQDVLPGSVVRKNQVVNLLMN